MADAAGYKQHGFGAVLMNLPKLPTREQRMANAIGNPITIFRSLTPMQHALYFSGWLAWTCDAIDFFAVSLTVSRLAASFGVSTTSITTSITLTLLFRSLGAVIFGLISDRYGRKWPLVVNLVIVAALEIGSAFVTTFSQFLAVRSLFGIGMGGIWGMSAATALENLPTPARGLYSGILQQGYAAGYLIAAIINLTAVANQDDWRVLFKIAAGISLFGAIVRAALPESQLFIDARNRRKAEGGSTTGKTRMFFHEMGRALKAYWIRAVLAVLLMTGFNFFSHGSQDLYPTYLQQAKGLTANLSTKATIIGNCGAIAGGTIAGYASQYLGRRITIIVCCLWTCCFIPLWIIPNDFGPLAAGAFFVQFGVQGAWGVIPIFLSELSPPQFRGVFPGLAYQLGNMISSASAQIESTAGESLRTNYLGVDRPDYGKIQGILIGVVAAWIIFITCLVPEDLGKDFSQSRAAYEDGGAKGELVTPTEHGHDVGVRDPVVAHANGARDEKVSSSLHEDEKAQVERV